MSEKNRARFGLLGRDIDYSFSRAYFTEKFQLETLSHCSYENFDLPHLDNFRETLNTPHLRGMNVTIPYKQEVMPYLDDLDEVSKIIGAVNTIVFQADGTTKGYNTDYIGFRESITPLLHKNITDALILGTGGASKAVLYALQKLGIRTQYVSRKNTANSIAYHEVNADIINTHKLIVNCTPLGTFPNVAEKPDLDYSMLTSKHVLFDLIYNPAETAFMKAGATFGATVSNGQHMLVGQAEASWELWNR
ncbi:MAG: shikimate dehydrogenase [Bacteroidetes bacterium]|nr:shikimate dehydrogenase [Bacteroidota bacterium]MDA0888611.1 shikimate dehydrogenase [Bacteroidota bacterium]MDA1085019.1 shikimate dehydrogenase [Bacteroidota bacterium]